MYIYVDTGGAEQNSLLDVHRADVEEKEKKRVEENGDMMKCYTIILNTGCTHQVQYILGLLF